jgi:hypothetical protein
MRNARILSSNRNDSFEVTVEVLWEVGNFQVKTVTNL